LRARAAQAPPTVTPDGQRWRCGASALALCMCVRHARGDDVRWWMTFGGGALRLSMERVRERNAN